MPKPLPRLADLRPLCCPPLGHGMDQVTDDDVVGLAVRLKALADPARLKIVALLRQQPGLDACTCDLAPALGLSEGTVSHHLKQLLGAGIVSKRRVGLNVHYTLQPEAISAIARTLDMAS